ncbi:MAG: response regulator transcription factor [Pseudomonadota bacterium]
MNIAVIGGSAWFVGALESVLAGRALNLDIAAEDTASFRARLNGSSGPRIVLLACHARQGEIAPFLAWARRHRPELRVVLKLARLSPALVRDAMQGGCRGCFSAEDAPEVVLGVLETVAAGRVSFPYVDLSTLGDDPFERLTERERDVLGALSRGWTNTQISARLGISENTVKYHLRLIYDKLGVANRATAVARFVARGV